ncbi:sulfite exporter TauE/SafE family protein [Mycobacterium sp. NPDC050853]|uniref:sulfite exporter TauE/SafE family protein n=1 Tax=Mycobacteriaceae TaxID=1762 RepID=UPI0015DF8A86|nr:sulfite exporter TauE/SafE family protein [Mycobacteroides sp. LB1]
MTERPGLGTLARIGVLGGISGGLLGGGTGVITVPSLARATALSRAVIHGTSTLPNVSAAIAGSTVYALHGAKVDVVAGAGLMAGGVIGAVVGAKLVARIPEWILKALFVFVLLATALKLLLSASGIDPSAGDALLPDGVLSSVPSVIAIGAFVGFVVGAWSAALGLGGGLLTVPAMLVLFGSDLHVAEGTSLMVMLPNALVASTTHLRQGTADSWIGFRLAAFALPGTVVGALLALALNARWLALVFGSYLVFIAIREIVRALKTRKPPVRQTKQPRPVPSPQACVGG